mgnify:CR=1 FL=1
MIQGDRELIDAYVQGTLATAERLGFEKRLLTDAVLKKETDALLLVLPVIKEAGRMNLKTKLSAIEATLPHQPDDYSPSKNNKGKLKAKGKFSVKWWWVIIAVTTIAGAIIAYRVLTHNSGEGHDCIDCATEQSVSEKQAVPQQGFGVPPAAGADTCLPGEKTDDGKPDGFNSDTSYLFSYETQEENGKNPKQTFTETNADTGRANPVLVLDMATASAIRYNNNKIVSIKHDSRYTFHYCYKGDSLLLYGPFEKSLLFYNNVSAVLMLNHRQKNYALYQTTVITKLQEVREGSAK